MNKICGIYLLKFNNTNKVYIGQSQDIQRRFSTHLNDMKKGKNSIKLQQAFKLYGEPYLEILLECSIDELDLSEIEAISIFDSINNGFNSVEGGGMYPILIGEFNARSIYLEEQIINAFMFLINNPEINLFKAEEILGIHRSTLKNINNGYSHHWLKDLFPDKYNILTERKGKRSINSLKYSGKPLPIAISPNGEEFIVEHITNFAKEHNLNRGALGTVLNGKVLQHKGWYSGGFIDNPIR